MVFYHIIYICIFLERYLYKYSSLALRGESIKRKVILHGPSTLTVSLPSKWVRNNNIQKGDELNVEEAGTTLKLYPGEEHLLTKKIQVDFSNMNKEVINSMMSVLHKSGYDEIEIIFNNPETVKIIQKRINSMLIGYEIIEQRGNLCIVKNVSGDHLSELDALIRRTFLVTLSLAKNSLEEIKKHRIEKLKELLILEKTNNKLTNYCHRLLNKKPYKDEKTIYTYLIIWVLESICDDYRDIIHLMLKKPKLRISQDLLDLYKRINDLFENYYHLFYNYSNEKMLNIRKKIAFLKQELLSMNSNNPEKSLRVYLFSILNRIYDCLGSTSGLHSQA